MVSNQDKMQTDYIWMKDHSYADTAPLMRTHGYNYLYYHAPNKRERLEMIWRSMGKAHDWELEKFRWNKKFPDRGNKKRFFKNFFRFMKHPTGYLFWKTYKFRQAKGRLSVTAMGIGFFFMIFKYKMATMRTAKKNNALLLAGKNIEGSATSYLGYHDNQMLQQSMPLSHWLYHPLPGHKIVVNPCRDQNYRKYFEMRKKYNVGQAEQN